MIFKANRLLMLVTVSTLAIAVRLGWPMNVAQQPKESENARR